MHGCLPTRLIHGLLLPPSIPRNGPLFIIIIIYVLVHTLRCDFKLRELLMQAQLVMVGPVGDVMGAEAQQTLVELAPRFLGRIYAPPGAYFSGPDKELLLRGADFCLVPSR